MDKINQLGYRPNDIKVGVFLSKRKLELQLFKIIDVSSGEVTMTFKNVIKTKSLEPFISRYRLPFAALKKSGVYRIVAGRAISPDFRIDEIVYNVAADFLLNHIRQQRCSYNPYLKDSCHTHDGYVIYGRQGDSEHIDATGGWHDAADYLKYVATPANRTYQMLFAYSENPASFGDKYLSNGLQGSDGLPDVLNESRWGLDWLIKMNLSPGIMFKQIADDRDHIGFRFPTIDTANYCKGKQRPVYFCTGKPQGHFKYKNRTTGVASTASKFASGFLPPYEWYNDSIATWTNQTGLRLVNISSGTIINQDWTFPQGKPYYSSDFLMNNFLMYEKEKGLNGYILLIHPGTDPQRTDKLYLRLDSILSYLEKKNYTFRSLSEIN